MRNNRMALARLKTFLGAETPLSEITPQRIGEYRVKRLTENSERIGRPVSPAWFVDTTKNQSQRWCSNALPREALEQSSASTR